MSEQISTYYFVAGDYIKDRFFHLEQISENVQTEK